MGHRRRVVLRTLTATLLAGPLLLVPGAGSAATRDDDPDLDVRITALSPSRLSDDSAVTMSGTVTNRDDHVWADAQAYLVIPTVPFTTRAQVDAAIRGDAAYTGRRIVELDTFDDMGDLAPDSTTPFRVRVPAKSLGLSGASGVYPVGVQILGTDVDGSRSTDAIGRATTFLPLVSGSDRPPVDAGVVWPFLMPDHRRPDGDYADPAGLLELVSPGGRLRNLLDLAAGTSARASTVLLDPALLVGVDDVLHGRHLADDVTVTDTQREAAQRFLDDLVSLSRRSACWVLGYDRPDVLAIMRSPDARALDRTVDTATSTTLAHFAVTGRRVAWPTRNGVTADLLADLRGTGEQPVLVSDSALPQWERRDGSLVQYRSASGPMPLLVDNGLESGVPGDTTVVTLRQAIVSEAALATLQQGVDPDSRADAITIVDPTWDPGPSGGADALGPVFDAPFVTGASLEDLITERLTQYDGRVPTTAAAEPIGSAQVAAAARAVSTSTLLWKILPDGTDVSAARARGIASVLGVRWREMRSEGLRAAEARAAAVRRQLARITVKGPAGVTLSGSEGSFPLTVSNDTENPIRIDVTIESSNPALELPDVRGIDVAAGERRTVTVTVDMGRQGSATLTATMAAPDGTTFGEPAVFNVRSSKVGVALWVAIGVAAAFVALALVRRFRGSRR